MTRGSSRREFLRRTGPALGGSWLLLNYPLILATAEEAEAAQANHASWMNLSADDADTLGAVVDQVFPPDENPGARDIGAVYFIDAAAGGFMASSLPLIQSGCRDLQSASLERHGQSFHRLAFDQQTPILEEIQDSPFFGLIHFLTLCGLFASPRHGGNKDGLGWQLLGFESRHAWQPPFGHYDAEHEKEQAHG